MQGGSAFSRLEQAMNEKMTIEEMEARFPREWVLIGDPVQDEHLNVKAGTVLFHSQDRSEADRKALELPVPRHCAIFYMGPIPEKGFEFVL
jgi:hypothetical protein